MGWGEWLSPRRIPIGWVWVVVWIWMGLWVLWLVTPGWGVERVDRTLIFEIIMGGGMILLLIGVWSIVRGLRDDLIDSEVEHKRWWKRQGKGPKSGSG